MFAADYTMFIQLFVICSPHSLHNIYMRLISVNDSLNHQREENVQNSTRWNVFWL